MSESIKIQMLASGSSGNSLFVRVGDTRLLVDAGISCRRITGRLEAIGESPAELDAVLLTHEHSDHVRGLSRLFDKWPDIALFCSRGTAEASDKFEPPAQFQTIVADRAFRVGDVEVEPFELLHDASEPCGFRLDAPGFSLGVATDLGEWSDEIAERLQGCRALVLEANHDADMLRHGPYPAFLKRRIAGRRGHLSNDQARALLSRVAGPQLEWVILAHLSQKNNAAERAIDHVSRALAEDSTANVIASSPKPGQLIEMTPSTQTQTSRPRQGLLL